MRTNTRILIEPNSTDEQLIKLYLSYKSDDSKIKEKNPKLFMECKNWVNANRIDILNQLKRKITGGLLSP